jgi:hypothetical protein
MPPTLPEWAQYMLIAAKSEDAKLQQLSESLREGSAQLAKSRLVASLDRKRLGADFWGGGGSRSEAFSIKASDNAEINGEEDLHCCRFGSRKVLKANGRLRKRADRFR